MIKGAVGRSECRNNVWGSAERAKSGGSSIEGKRTAQHVTELVIILYDTVLLVTDRCFDLIE